MENFEKSLQEKDEELKDTNPGELSRKDKEKQNRLLIEHLEERFKDEMLPVLKDGGTSDESIEKIKEIWIKNEMDAAEDLEFSEKRSLNAHDMLMKSIFDSVSGLQRREGLYKLMDSVLGDSLSNIKSEEELLNTLKNGKELTAEDKECCVMMGDVSFLSLVNEAGHASGDELINEICGALKEAEKSANMVDFRHGGDELDNVIATNILSGVTINGVTGTATAKDTTPTTFAFTDQTEVALSTLTESNILKIVGMDNNIAISITGDGSPAYRICSNNDCSSVTHTWSTSAGTIENNEYLQLRLTSNALESTANSATVIVGTGSDSWSVTTGVLLTWSGSVHVESECTDSGGTVYDTGSGTICQYTSATVPAGWTQASHWQRYSSLGGGGDVCGRFTRTGGSTSFANVESTGYSPGEQEYYTEPATCSLCTSYWHTSTTSIYIYQVVAITDYSSNRVEIGIY